MTKKRRSGFTLTELLAGLGIMLLLVAALFPAILAAREAVGRLGLLIDQRHTSHGVAGLESTPQISPVASDTPGPPRM